MAQKFKKGQQVRVIDKKYGHGFHKGTIVTIAYCNPNANRGEGDYLCKTRWNEVGWYLTDEELQELED